MGRHPSSLPTTLAVALFLLLRAGALQADFCEDLDRIISSSSEGFRQVRGELVTSVDSETTPALQKNNCYDGPPRPSIAAPR